MNASPCFAAPLSLARITPTHTVASTPRRRSPYATLPVEKRAAIVRTPSAEAKNGTSRLNAKNRSTAAYFAHLETATARLVHLGLAIALVPELEQGRSIGGHIGVLLSPLAYVAKQFLVAAAQAQLPPAGL